jgi:hypothetical protein
MIKRKIWILTVFNIFILQIAMGQHNLIDIPSSDIVEYKKVFFQAQAAFTKDEINTTTIFTYGFGKKIEVGLTLYQLDFQKSKGVEINPDEPEKNVDLLINAQKGFSIKDWFKIGIGTRSGINAAKDSKQITFVNFDYFNTQFSTIENKHKFVAGIYYGNNAYAGEGTNWGLMLGVDATVLKEKIHFVSDFTSGNSSLSVVNAGFEISLPKEWKITIAAQFPVPGSDNNQGATLQISKN